MQRSDSDTALYRVRAIAVAGTSTDWVYNYFVQKRVRLLGFIPFWKELSAHSFTFSRYSNNPKADGLKEAMRIQRSRYPFLVG